MLKEIEGKYGNYTKKFNSKLNQNPPGRLDYRITMKLYYSQQMRSINYSWNE